MKGNFETIVDAWNLTTLNGKLTRFESIIGLLAEGAAGSETGRLRAGHYEKLCI